MIETPFNLIKNQLSEDLPEELIKKLPNKWEKIGDVVTLVLSKELEKYKGEMIRGETDFIDSVMAFTASDMLYCMARDAGVSFHTLRNYYYVVEFFEKDTIELLGAFLPFSYFEYAKSQGPENALSILELAADEYHRRGCLNCGLDWLKMQFHNAAGDPGIVDGVQAVSNFDDHATQYYDDDDFQVVANDDQDSGQVLFAPIWYLINAAGKLFEKIEKNISQPNLDSETRERFMIWLQSIQEMTEELKSEYSHSEK